MNMNWEKKSHLSSDEMRDLLDSISPQVMSRAIIAWKNGRRPKNIGRFRPAKSWLVGGYPHRPLISLACEMTGEREIRTTSVKEMILCAKKGFLAFPEKFKVEGVE